jgi:membrane protein required for colicin V production
MTGFDIGIFVVVAATAISGFMRGLVQEIMALAAWVFALAAIHYFHTPLSQKLVPFTGEGMGAAPVLAFVLLLMVPYVIIKFLSKRMGDLSRESLLAPIDRMLGLGFGVLKGLVVVVLGFSIMVMAYDTVWGIGGRPVWITQARTYPFINAGSESLVKMIGERRSKAAEAEKKRLDKK